MLTMDRVDLSEIIDKTYMCKMVLSKIYFDPEMSTVIIGSVYDYLSSNKNNKISYFQFNDVNKFIDIELKTKAIVAYEIDNAMAYSFKQIADDPQLFSRLYHMSEYAISFKQIVDMYHMNNKETGQILFNTYNILPMINNTDNRIIYRVKLL